MRRIALALVVLALGLAGCGSDDGTRTTTMRSNAQPVHREAVDPAFDRQMERVALLLREYYAAKPSLRSVKAARVIDVAPVLARYSPSSGELVGIDEALAQEILARYGSR